MQLNTWPPKDEMAPFGLLSRRGGSIVMFAFGNWSYGFVS